MTKKLTLFFVFFALVFSLASCVVEKDPAKYTVTFIVDGSEYQKTYNLLAANAYRY